MMNPAGSSSEAISNLSWILFVMGAVVLTVVLVATFCALRGSETLRARIASEKAIVIGGLAFPILVLTALLSYGLALTSRLAAEPATDALRIQIIGHQWWWEVHYLNDEGIVLETANEIRIPVDRPIVVELESADVIHSFWIPQLAGKLDMIPGRRNILQLNAKTPGTYGGQCAEYCGGAHAFMTAFVVALPPDEFELWLANEISDATTPNEAFRGRGEELFIENGCGACHTIRGTEAAGNLGPDLTHIGSRNTIGAGLYPRNQGTIAGWISDSQTLKPENLMPSYDQLTGEDLRALAAYLDSLK